MKLMELYTLQANDKKIGPILAINSEDFNQQYVAGKLIKIFLRKKN